MQRLEDAGLLGTQAPAARPTPADRSLPALVGRAVVETAAPVTRPQVRSRPQVLSHRPPMESRPAGARLGQVVGGAPVQQARGIVDRLAAGDPLVLGALRRDPVALRRWSAAIDRALAGARC